MSTSLNDEMLRIDARKLEENPKKNGEHQYVTEQVKWNPRQTSVIICDMWDCHWCRGAQMRVSEMARHMNMVVKELRNRGALIINAPSETMDFYEGYRGRREAQKAPAVQTCMDEGKFDWIEEVPIPIDYSDGGCACAPQCQLGKPWTRQIDTIEIMEYDIITDSIEAFYVMKERGIQNVIIMGVHTNICVLGRPFGIRQMVKLGQNVLMMRDLTDSMYNPQKRPWVDHFSGTELVIQYIEKYWCPTITSNQIVGGKPFRFSEAN